MADDPGPDGVARGAASAWVALGVLLLGTTAIVIFAAAGRSALVSGSSKWGSFPDWLSGPLHGAFGPLTVSPGTLNDGLSALLIVMTVAYFYALRGAGSLSMRVIAGFVLLVEAILLLGPPLEMSDLFNYLGYARLWALHGLNPYTHVIGNELRDRVYRFTSWRNWRSPYGSLFTAVTYPVGLIELPAAYWAAKLATVLVSFVFLWLVARCAQLLGSDPRPAVLMVAANPIYLIYAVGGFHNDFFMLVPAIAAVALLLSERYRSAGVAVAVGIAVKLTVIVLLPFLMFAAWLRRRCLRLLSGVVIGAIPLAALSVALFGLTLPNVAGQNQLLTGLSVPNLLGWALGLGGGTPSLVRDMDVVIIAVVGYQLLRRRDWLSGAGWATLALLASLGWLMPWYVVWLLPLAALASSGRLRRAALAFSVFVLVTFLPVTGSLLSTLDLNPAAGPVGLAAWHYQWTAQFGRPDARRGRRGAHTYVIGSPARCPPLAETCLRPRRADRA